jgi:quinolinate synthase
MYFSLPKEYREADATQLQQRIDAARDKLGTKLCILTHHYQRRQVVANGDHVGDSYGLSKLAAEQAGVEVIIFCGVHFMAEAADIVSGDHQTVYLANPLAGCPMADMAEMADVMEAWTFLEQFGGDECIMPISYMNTTAGLKAFTGRHGGLICTSSNAPAAFRYAFERRDKVFFFPDENLGWNTGLKFGLKPEEMVVWDFSREDGGLSEAEIERARIIPHEFHRRSGAPSAPGAARRSGDRASGVSARRGLGGRRLRLH